MADPSQLPDPFAGSDDLIGSNSADSNNRTSSNDGSTNETSSGDSVAAVSGGSSAVVASGDSSERDASGSGASGSGASGGGASSGKTGVVSGSGNVQTMQELLSTIQEQNRKGQEQNRKGDAQQQKQQNRKGDSKKKSDSHRSDATTRTDAHARGLRDQRSEASASQQPNEQSNAPQQPKNEDQRTASAGAGTGRQVSQQAGQRRSGGSRGDGQQEKKHVVQKNLRTPQSDQRTHDQRAHDQRKQRAQGARALEEVSKVRSLGASLEAAEQAMKPAHRASDDAPASPENTASENTSDANASAAQRRESGSTSDLKGVPVSSQSMRQSQPVSESSISGVQSGKDASRTHTMSTQRTMPTQQSQHSQSGQRATQDVRSLSQTQTSAREQTRQSGRSDLSSGERPGSARQGEMHARATNSRTNTNNHTNKSGMNTIAADQNKNSARSAESMLRVPQSRSGEQRSRAQSKQSALGAGNGALPGSLKATIAAIAVIEIILVAGLGYMLTEIRSSGDSGSQQTQLLALEDRIYANELRGNDIEAHEERLAQIETTLEGDVVSRRDVEQALAAYQATLQASSSDTDGDGLSDYEELFLYETDPYASDTDGDGYLDGEEVDAFYAPLTEGRDAKATAALEQFQSLVSQSFDEATSVTHSSIQDGAKASLELEADKRMKLIGQWVIEDVLYDVTFNGTFVYRPYSALLRASGTISFVGRNGQSWENVDATLQGFIRSANGSAADSDAMVWYLTVPEANTEIGLKASTIRLEWPLDRTSENAASADMDAASADVNDAGVLRDATEDSETARDMSEDAANTNERDNGITNTNAAL